MKNFLLIISCVLITSTISSQNITTFPYFTGFEGVEGTLNYNYPDGWTYEDLNVSPTGNQSWQILKNSESYTNARTDSTAIHMLAHMSESNNDWLYTPGIEMMAGNTYTLSFWYNTIDFAGTSEKLKVHIGSEASSTSMSIDPLWDNTLTNTTYQEGTIEYTPDSDGTFFFGFHCYSDAFQYILILDDITISEAPTNIIFEAESMFSIYPNPCSDYLHLNNVDILSNNMELSISDLSGKTIYKSNINSKDFTISTSDFKNGLYTLRISKEDKIIYTQKIQVLR